MGIKKRAPATPRKPRAGVQAEVSFNIRFSHKQHAAYLAAAAKRGLALATWMRLELDRIAEPTP